MSRKDKYSGLPGLRSGSDGFTKINSDLLPVPTSLMTIPKKLGGFFAPSQGRKKSVGSEKEGSVKLHWDFHGQKGLKLFFRGRVGRGGHHKERKEGGGEGFMSGTFPAKEVKKKKRVGRRGECCVCVSSRVTGTDFSLSSFPYFAFPPLPFFRGERVSLLPSA